MTAPGSQTQQNGKAQLASLLTGRGLTTMIPAILLLVSSTIAADIITGNIGTSVLAGIMIGVAALLLDFSILTIRGKK